MPHTDVHRMGNVPLTDSAYWPRPTVRRRATLLLFPLRRIGLLFLRMLSCVRYPLGVVVLDTIEFYCFVLAFSMMLGGAGCVFLGVTV